MNVTASSGSSNIPTEGQSAAPIGGTGRSASGIAKAPACTLVIFGAGGDLTKRLLTPALYDLSGSQLLSEELKIIGVDHADDSAEGWRASLSEAMQSFTHDSAAGFHAKSIDPTTWGWISSRLDYLKGDFEQSDLYAELAKRLTGNVIFYFAVAARFFAPITNQLGSNGLLKESDDGFRRIIIEKPFGSDLQTAKALNQTLLKSAAESQIYRIDHFLGKETVQSIMAVRFSNTLFEPIWSRTFVDHVQITAAETIGVENRGAFYDSTGAMRDMVPNHLFQLLCMTAIEEPASFDAEAVRSAKAKLVESIHPLSEIDAVRGQYMNGSIKGSAVNGYLQEANVAPSSITETYAAVRLYINNERWQGVPFYLRTGKCLADRLTEIAVVLKSRPSPLFGQGASQANIIRIKIDPLRGIDMALNVKVPGPQMQLGHMQMAAQYDDFFSEPPNVGYETLLYDCMRGDATLFQRADNIEAGWSVVDPIIQAWKYGAPEQYAAGSNGPKSADELLNRDGRHWLSLDPASNG